METILYPAILWPDNKPLTGNSHEEIRITAMDRGVFLHPFDKASEGFLTSENRFVSREEAAEIAFSVGQVKEKVQSLCSYHLNSSL